MNALYEHAFRHVLFPLYESGLRRRQTLRHLADYQRDQWLSSRQLAELQWTRLKRLLDYCYREVPYYRQRWRELGVVPAEIRNLADFACLPLLRKSDIREHFDALKATRARDSLLYKSTGGSTGEPLRFGYTRDSNERRNAVMWRGYGWAGARLGRRTLFVWGGAVGEPSRSQRLKDRFYNAAFARQMLDSFQMSEANMADFADAIDRYRPRMIVGYVGPLLQLAEWLIAHKRAVRPPLGLIAAAEALHEFQRERLQQAFGAPVFNTYGCREFMLIAAECEQQQGLHINADHLLVELARADSAAVDDAGEVIITDLFNYGMPFIRYANGDLASPAHAPCACGRGLPLLSRVEGRVLDAIHTADGHRLPGEFFPHMLKDVPGLRRFQLVQRRLDRIDLSIVRDDDFDEASLSYIRREIGKVLGDSVELHCHFPDEIALTPSGKRRVTISELAR